MAWYWVQITDAADQPQRGYGYVEAESTTGAIHQAHHRLAEALTPLVGIRTIDVSERPGMDTEAVKCDVFSTGGAATAVSADGTLLTRQTLRLANYTPK